MSVKRFRLSESFRLVSYSWAHILHHLAKSHLHYSSFHLLEVVFFHPIFPNRPQELCSQSSANGLTLQNVTDLGIVDVIKGCIEVAEYQDSAEPWSNDPVSIAIKDGRYTELSLMSLMRLQKLFPAGTSAIVFTRLPGVTMKPGVFLHEVKRGHETDKDEIRPEGVSAECNQDKLREYSWIFLKMLETQLQAKITHFQAIYKLTQEKEEPYIAYVLKCMARPFAPQKKGHYRSSSSVEKEPLTTCISAANLWKTSKTMKLRNSKRPFILHPGDSILRPKDLPPLPAPRALQVSSTPVTSKLHPASIRPTRATRSKEPRKRLVVPILRRNLQSVELLTSMQLQGTAWQHSISMEGKLRRRKTHSQRRFKPSFLQSPSNQQAPKFALKDAVKRPRELNALEVVSWMEIFTEGRKEVLLHQALAKSKHRHAPQMTSSKDPAQVLVRGKTPELTKRYSHLLATRRLRTAEVGTRPVSRPVMSAASSPVHRDLWSRGVSPKLHIEGSSTGNYFPTHNPSSGTPVSATPHPRPQPVLPPKQPSCKLTYFNPAVIPAQPVTHLTVLDIRRYIDYLDQPAFR